MMWYQMYSSCGFVFCPVSSEHLQQPQLQLTHLLRIAHHDPDHALAVIREELGAQEQVDRDIHLVLIPEVSVWLSA